MAKEKNVINSMAVGRILLQIAIRIAKEEREKENLARKADLTDS